jgi:hypothetical protein
MSEWLQKGASQGDVNCQFTLGVTALNRRAYSEALRWFQRAAVQSHAMAQEKIGLMYRDGLGVKQDPVEALMWFTLAAKISGQYFTPLRDALAIKMAPAEVEEAVRRANAWTPATKKSSKSSEPEGLLT